MQSFYLKHLNNKLQYQRSLKKKQLMKSYDQCERFYEKRRCKFVGNSRSVKKKSKKREKSTAS